MCRGLGMCHSRCMSPEARDKGVDRGLSAADLAEGWSKPSNYCLRALRRSCLFVTPRTLNAFGPSLSCGASHETAVFNQTGSIKLFFETRSAPCTGVNPL